MLGSGRKSIKSVENPEKVWYSETEMQDRKERKMKIMAVDFG